MKIVIEKAEPVLGYKSKFARYVKHWDVSGYTWNGDCICTKKMFSCDLPELSGKLEVTELEIKAFLANYL
jgi:hypothetical protein